MVSRDEIDSALKQIRDAAATGQLDVAEQLTKQLIEDAPDEPEAWSWWGLIELARRRITEAEAAFRRAIELMPGHGHYWSYLAITLRELGRAGEAESAARAAITIDNRQAAYWMALGSAVLDQGRWSEAAEAYREVVASDKQDAAAWQALGAAEHSAGRFDAAEEAFQRSLAIVPGGDATIGYAQLLARRGELQRAMELLAAYLSRVPDSVVAAAVLFHVAQEAGHSPLTEWACRHALELNARQLCSHPDWRPSLLPLVHSSLLFKLPFFPGYDSRAIDEEARRWNQQHATPLAKCIQPHANDRTADRRLRVGYVSANFRNHCQAFFLQPLFAAHDRARVEVVCYSDVGEPDEITAGIRTRADVWREIIGQTDEQVAELIRQDQIDILVDLTMHMEQNRLLVFARKPAPVQVSWLAYPGTTGMTAIDYRLSDPHLDPPGLFDSHYSEQTVRLPETFWCYDPLVNEPAVGPLPAVKNSYVTFGNLNSIAKVNLPTLQLWARVLRAVERSRMVLLAPPGPARERMLNCLVQEGIAPERIRFVEFQPRLPYLKVYHQIDLVLDTMPYNGHTTSLDGFWMGVPVVTLVERIVVGRAGLSMLRNLRLPELTAESPEQFVQIAVQLASNLEVLSRLRAMLRGRMQSSPLMDAPRFARGMEAAYRWMWEQWCLSRS